MKVSIITICYNSGNTIRDTIESVIAQDYPNIEYIIKDGCSTDNTLKVINEYKNHIAKITSTKDVGLYDAINQGIELATGDIIGLIHADDLLFDSKVISKIVAQFQTQNTDAVYGDLQYVDKDDVLKIFRNWKAGEYKAGLFLKGWMPPHPTFYVKKNSYDKLGLYDTSFKSAGDYELMLRYIHKEKISVSYLAEVIVKMRVGGKSNASIFNRVKANLEDRKAWKINGITPNFLTLFQKPFRKIKQFF